MQRFWILLLIWGIAACGKSDDGDFIARVGDRKLTRQELDQALSSMTKGADLKEARNQILEQWITTELLAQEAERRDLTHDPEVQKLIQESTRSVIISAMLERIRQESPEPSTEEIARYFQENQSALVLREPYVRIRYLRTKDQTKADRARNELLEALKTPTKTDERWKEIVKKYGDDPSGTLAFSYHYIPESRLEDGGEAIWQILAQLNPGELSDLKNIDGIWHVVQLVDRVPQGASPRLPWITDEIRQQLQIRAQKVQFATFVQDLKNKAAAKGALEINLK